MTVDRSADRAAEQAFEAVLAGRPVDGEGDLAAFTAAVRATTARAPQPNAALTALLSTGLLADQSPSTRTADQAAAIARPPRRRPTTVISDLLAAALAKTASAGIAVKCSAAVGVALAGLTTVGSLQALPASAQEVFNQVVHVDAPSGATTGEPVTSSSPSQPADATTQAPSTTTGAPSTATETPGGTATTTATSTATTTPGTTGDPATDTTSETPGTGSSATPTSGGIGGYMSSGRHSGSVEPGDAADIAHHRNDSRKSGRTAAPSTGADDQGEDTGDDSQATTSDDDSDDSATTSGSGAATQTATPERQGGSAHRGSSSGGSSGSGSAQGGNGKGGHGSDD
jgi:hypothetical protein